MRNEEARCQKIFRAVFACQNRETEQNGGRANEELNDEAEARAGERSEQQNREGLVYNSTIWAENFVCLWFNFGFEILGEIPYTISYLIYIET